MLDTKTPDDTSAKNERSREKSIRHILSSLGAMLKADCFGRLNSELLCTQLHYVKCAKTFDTVLFKVPMYIHFISITKNLY